MELLIHGHSCCEIRLKNISLICDPWLLGSSYWRSWWNFPEPENLNNLIDLWKEKEYLFIYITHLHWDHFHGPSLRKIIRSCKNVTFLIPETPEPRLKSDLETVIGKKIRTLELTHKKKFTISNDLSVLSFQTGVIFADSILSIQVKNIHLLNMNDSKILPLSLSNLLKVVPKPDYVLRSHSSANDRCCFRDKNGNALDKVFDKRRIDYSREFFDSCYLAGAKYAVPFASNMACLHRETFQYNSILNFSDYVYEDFKKISEEYPGMECKLILPTEKIFLDNNTQKKNMPLRDLLVNKNRIQLLKDYQMKKNIILNKQYEIEDKEVISEKLIRDYFNFIVSKTPFILRKYLNNHINFEVFSENKHEKICIDFKHRKVYKLDEIIKNKNNVIVRVSGYVLNDVCKNKHYNSLGTSKRIKVFASKGNFRYFIFNIVCNAIETESFLPLKNIFRKKYALIWIKRYPEFFDLIFYFIKYFLFAKRPIFIIENNRKIRNKSLKK